MSVTINLPEEVEHQLQTAWDDLSRPTLEALAVESYYSEVLTRSQVSEILGLNFWETEAFLKARGAYLHYTIEDLEHEV